MRIPFGLNENGKNCRVKQQSVRVHSWSWRASSLVWYNCVYLPGWFERERATAIDGCVVNEMPFFRCFFFIFIFLSSFFSLSLLLTLSRAFYRSLARFVRMWCVRLVCARMPLYVVWCGVVYTYRLFYPFNVECLSSRSCYGWFLVLNALARDDDDDGAPVTIHRHTHIHGALYVCVFPSSVDFATWIKYLRWYISHLIIINNNVFSHTHAHTPARPTVWYWLAELCVCCMRRKCVSPRFALRLWPYTFNLCRFLRISRNSFISWMLSQSLKSGQRF